MRLLLAALLATPAFLPAPAHAALTQPAGEPCESYITFGDEDWGEATVFTGPYDLIDEDTGLPHTATVTCSFRRGYDHTSPVVDSATSDPGLGVVALPPTTLDLTSVPWWENVGLCTQLDTDAGPLYWYQPYDRNSDGYWSTDPAVRCEDLYETLDLRPQDAPLGPVLSVAQTVLGEADPAFAAAESALCDTEVWVCGHASETGALSIVRVPGAAVLRTAVPYGWTCTDRHSGLPVTQGSLLTVPSPGVTCTTEATVRCDWLEMSAYLAPTTTGRVTATEACGDLVLRRPLVPLQGKVAEQWTGMYGHGSPPLRCEADDDTALEPAYVIACYRF